MQWMQQFHSLIWFDFISHYYDLISFQDPHNVLYMCRNYYTLTFSCLILISKFVVFPCTLQIWSANVLSRSADRLTYELGNKRWNRVLYPGTELSFEFLGYLGQGNDDGTRGTANLNGNGMCSQVCDWSLITFMMSITHALQGRIQYCFWGGGGGCALTHITSEKPEVPIPGGQKKNPEQSIQSIFRTLLWSTVIFFHLAGTSFPHYDNTKIHKFGWELFILWVISYGLSF